MNPSSAARLIGEDERGAHSINFNDTVEAAELRDIVSELARTRSRSLSVSSSSVGIGHSAAYGRVGGSGGKGKGKARVSDDEEGSDEDDILWEPPASLEEREAAAARRKSTSDKGGYQPYPMAHESVELVHTDREGYKHTRSESGGGGGGGSRRGSRARSDSVSSVDKRLLRIMWWRRAAINVLFILAWYLFSTLLSVYNKWMLSKDHFDWPYPLFVTSVHMLVQWTLASITLAIFPRLRPSSRPSGKDYGTKIAPCGMATGLDIGLSNLSLRSITLSFYTMCKSSSLAFVLLFAFLFKLEKPSWRLAGIILIITSGVVLMVSTETQFDPVGMIEVLTASALGGLRWSLTQMLLDKEHMGMGNPIATLFWLAPVMGVTLASCSLIFDGWGNVFSNEKFFGTLADTLWTSTVIIFPGTLAFMMNIAEFGLIQRTSVVTLSVAGIFKEVAVIFLSMFIFHDQLTPINVSGLVVTIFGIALYNYLQYDKAVSGHGGHGSKAAVPGPSGFAPVPGNARNDEEESMLGSPRARHAARVLGTTNASATSFDGDEARFAAPLHSLGDDNSSSDGTSSSRSSFEIPSSQPNSHALHRKTHASKSRQHEDSRIEGLEERLEKDPTLVELELKEREVERSLEDGMRGHKEADDWDLLLGGGEDEEERGQNPKKGL